MAARGGTRRPLRSRLWGLAAMALALSVVATACSSTQTQSNGSGNSGTSGIPASAFKDTTGITKTSVTVGNVSTKIGNLFTGAVVGTEAYFDYVNSKGGVNGRMLHVDAADDGYNGAKNKSFTQQAIQKDFAMVGSFSLEDNFGGQVLKSNPGVPNVTVSLDQNTNRLPNTFSPQPAVGGWPLGPLQYFKSKYPDAIKKVGSIVANQPSAETDWAGEKAAMESIGYNIVYDQTFPVTQQDFNSNVVAMKNAGVKILFLEQQPENYAGAVMKALTQQNFHPIVVFGASTYSSKLVKDSGGAAAVEGAYLQQSDTLYLGEDRNAVPAVDTFLTWVKKADPSWAPDLFTLFGWLSGELFTQALRAAGPNPTRGSVLQQLGKITSFNGNHIEATVNPAGKKPATCYIIARFKNGTLSRLDDPPIDGPTHGFRCDYGYYYPKGTS